MIYGIARNTTHRRNAVGNVYTGIPGAYASTPLTTIAPSNVNLRGAGMGNALTDLLPTPADLSQLAGDTVAYAKAHPVAAGLLLLMLFK